MSSGTSTKNVWAGRLNSAMRRSTILNLGRSSASRPSSIRSRSSSDAAFSPAHKIDTLASAPEPLVAHTMPSPISESPLKEMDATGSIGHSALSQELPRSSSPEPLDLATSPAEYVPPPVMDHWSGNPGAFKDQDEEIPQPIVVSDPHRLASNQDDPSSHAPSFRELSAPKSAPHNIAPAYEEDSALCGPDSISVHKTQNPVDVPGYPATGDNSTSETAQYPNDAPTREDYNPPMERGGDLTSVPLTDPIDPPSPIDIVNVPKHSSPIDPAQQDPLSASYDTVPVENSRTNILASSPCSEPGSNGSVHLDHASVHVKLPLQQITLSASCAPDVPTMPRYVPTIFCKLPLLRFCIFLVV